MAIAVSKEQLAEWAAKGLIDAPRPAAAKTQPTERPAAAVRPVRRTIRLDIPVQTVSESNIGKSLKAKLARKTAVKSAIRGAFAGLTCSMRPAHPWRVTLIRRGLKRLDDGNLGTALKSVQDMVAEWLGVDDGDRLRVRWKYKQAPAWAPTVTVVIEG